MKQVDNVIEIDFNCGIHWLHITWLQKSIQFRLNTASHRHSQIVKTKY